MCNIYEDTHIHSRISTFVGAFIDVMNSPYSNPNQPIITSKQRLHPNNVLILLAEGVFGAHTHTEMIRWRYASIPK